MHNCEGRGATPPRNGGKYEKAVIIGIIANSDREIGAANTIALVEHYEGICIYMLSIVDEANEDLIDHDFLS